MEFFNALIPFFTAISHQRQVFMLEYGPKEQLPCLENPHVQNDVAVSRSFVPIVWRGGLCTIQNLFFSAISQHENLLLMGYGVKEWENAPKEQGRVE